MNCFEKCDEICLKRAALAETWGVDLSYSLSPDHGLVFISSR